MDKDFWKGFFRFLDEANTGEIQGRLSKTRDLLDQGIGDIHVRADAKRIIRFLEQELVARSGNQP